MVSQLRDDILVGRCEAVSLHAYDVEKSQTAHNETGEDGDVEGKGGLVGFRPHLQPDVCRITALVTAHMIGGVG